MRDILFRGKRTDNGDWVEGYYAELPVGSLATTIFSNDEEIVCEDTASYIIKVFEKQHSNYSSAIPLQVIECEKYQIIPKTVGQYTGLTDKNGTKIFEGDIVKWKDRSYEVAYITKYTRFAARKPKTIFTTVPLCLSEVIGNVWDNPKLMEEWKDE